MSSHPPNPNINRSQISNHPYSPSLSSSASSSASSIFSVATSVSSVASSVASLTSVNSSEGINYLGDTERHTWSHEQCKETSRQSVTTRALRVPPLAAEQRVHNRRSNRVSEVNKATCPADACPLPHAPTLVRQAERKNNFVDNLVDSAAQIVETIWPTYMNGKTESSGGKGVLPLRTFIQETLRRSRTSYSTLQVALYYLIIIRPHIPKGDFSDLSQENAQQMRALQCGRRMFLAALILASKYLQDRNYSARAWSRISGLQTTEININEMAFLEAVNWRLHISEIIFQKWTDLVVKYTSGPGSPNDDARKSEWSRLILKLTPQLNIEEDVTSGNSKNIAHKVSVTKRTADEVAACLLRADSDDGRAPSHSNQAPSAYVAKISASSTCVSVPKVTVSSLLSSPSCQSTPLPTLEPQPQNPSFKSLPQPTRLPALSVVSPLKAPAVRFGSGNAMVSAAAAAQLSQLQRCTTEDMSFLSRKCPGEKILPHSSAVRSTMLTRRSSLSCSMTSSPETLNDSDSSATSSPFAFSRSSSISSSSSFDSVGSFDAGKRCHKVAHIMPPCIEPASAMESKIIPNGSGLNAPTPSPPRYLALRPRASTDLNPLSGTKSPVCHSRKRRICELVPPALGEDHGVSPNMSSGMTPQMKVQLQMRTPPLNNAIGSKRLRCGNLEAHISGYQSVRGLEEEVL